jgi:DNA-binding transcriptional LysR family regulator
LARSFYPRWLSRQESVFASVPTQTFAMNVEEAVRSLARHECEFLITYHHPQLPLALDAGRHAMLTLGVEAVRPYSAADALGAPLHRLGAGLDRPIPYLAYAPGAWLGGIAELLLAHMPQPPRLKTVYRNDMAENLKAMALEGHGVAFLPESTVAREVELGQLVPAADAPLDDALTARLEIRIVRDTAIQSAFLDRIWEQLRAGL